MQRNLMRIEPAQVHPDQRFAPRHVRTASRSAGFFTIGFAIAVLAASALFAGAAGSLDVAESASAQTPSGTAVERTQSVDHEKTDGARNVVISEAPARSPKDARGATEPLQ